MASLAGAEVPIVWRGRRTHAFVPTLLIDRDLTLDIQTAARAARASSAAEHAAELMPVAANGLGRLLLRSEGVASSYIEGIVAPIAEIVLAEKYESVSHTAGAWVAANLVAFTQALNDAQSARLSVKKLCSWHRSLMAGSPLPLRYVGVIREEQGWIGGTSPFDAHLVTPPPDMLDELLADLIAYVNSTDPDPIVQAAVAHAQFEIIHPFADGNGRVGRILIAWILARRLALVTPPPTSTAIATDVGGYSAGLTLFRYGQHGQWIRWFADAVVNASRRQQELVAAAEALARTWRGRLTADRPGRRRLRANSTAWRVLELITPLLILDSRSVATALGVPLKTAGLALHELSEAGILTVIAGRPANVGRPILTYTSVELLGLAGSAPLRS